MRYFSIALYIYFQFTFNAQAESIHALWWNVDYGIHQNNPHTISQHLKAIISAPKPPDILAFAEYKENDQFLESDTTKKLSEIYPYSFFRIYSEEGRQDWGIKIYSQHPIELKTEDQIGWIPNHILKQSLQSQINYKKLISKNGYNSENYTRPYLRFEIDHPLGRFQFIPIHFLNPWLSIKNEKIENYITQVENYLGDLKVKIQSPVNYISNKKASLDVLYKILFDLDNPLALQVSRFREAYENDHISHSSPVIMGGDLNLPRSIYGQTPVALSHLTEGFEAITTGKTPTFPYPNIERYKDYPKLPIDSWYKKNVGRSSHQVLNLDGASHYPVYFTFELSP